MSTVYSMSILSQDLLSVSQQGIGQQSGFSLPTLCPISSNPYSHPSQYQGDRTLPMIQHPFLLSTTYMNNKSPSRDDSASPTLAYPGPQPKGPGPGSAQANPEAQDFGSSDTCALTPYYDESSKGSSNKENDKPDRPLCTRDFHFIHRYARVACIFWHAHNCFPDRLVRLSGDILSVANCQVIPEYNTNINEHNPVAGQIYMMPYK